jgi:hypothetical protein
MMQLARILDAWASSMANPCEQPDGKRWIYSLLMKDATRFKTEKQNKRATEHAQ